MGWDGGEDGDLGNMGTWSQQKQSSIGGYSGGISKHTKLYYRRGCHVVELLDLVNDCLQCLNETLSECPSESLIDVGTLQ